MKLLDQTRVRIEELQPGARITILGPARRRVYVTILPRTQVRDDGLAHVIAITDFDAGVESTEASLTRALPVIEKGYPWWYISPESFSLPVQFLVTHVSVVIQD